LLETNQLNELKLTRFLNDNKKDAKTPKKPKNVPGHKLWVQANNDLMKVKVQIKQLQHARAVRSQWERATQGTVVAVARDSRGSNSGNELGAGQAASRSTPPAAE
jgi:hypothetical protein